jgi:hypothetical protein
MRLSVRRHHLLPRSGGDESYWWRVECEGIGEVRAELPQEERASLDLTDEQLHELLPTALERHAASRGAHDITAEAPVMLFADHFRG